MEELLNKLIEKGWKPRGKNAYNCCDNAKRIRYEGGEKSYRDYIEITPRELVSKESGLWQFVCENGMINKNKQYSFIKWSWKGRTDERNQQSYRYRLIETALTDEDKLEQFLLENIKVE